MKHHMSFTPVGVQILVATHEKYLFRSLLTTQRTPLGVFLRWLGHGFDLALQRAALQN